MDIVKKVNRLKVGTPIVVTTTWQDTIERRVTIYMGKDEIGRYSFFDDTGLYKCTAKYIVEHMSIERKIKYVADLYKVMDLCKKITERSNK